MRYDPDKHHRRSIRLKGYDYALPGAYFVTICAQDRECLFGEIIGQAMQINAAGSMLQGWWAEIANKFPAAQPETHVVMPNHFHGIIITGALQGARTGAPLPEIVQWFKTMTTNEYIRRVKAGGWRPFPGRLWQRNYYERIIRDEGELNRTRQYIIDNPAKWTTDPENPAFAAAATS